MATFVSAKLVSESGSMMSDDIGRGRSFVHGRRHSGYCSLANGLALG